MREIALTREKVALVDDADYPALSQHKWQAIKGARAWYAARRDRDGQTVLMHRQILQPPKGVPVDHRNGEGLDNRRSNLRLCTRQQNAQNSRKQIAALSAYKGVTIDNKKWQARIQIDGKRVFLGRFAAPEEAARAYDQAATKAFGEFAHINGV